MSAILLGVCVVIATGAWFIQYAARLPTLVHIGSTTVWAEVASNGPARTKGLGGRPHLPAGKGMLFVFETDSTWSIWMKDMHFAIDIIWLDADKRVVDVVHNVDSATYPRAFKPSQQARYVLEVPAHTAQQAGIAIGQQATFSLP